MYKNQYFFLLSNILLSNILLSNILLSNILLSYILLSYILLSYILRSNILLSNILLSNAQLHNILLCFIHIFGSIVSLLNYWTVVTDSRTERETRLFLYYIFITHISWRGN